MKNILNVRIHFQTLGFSIVTCGSTYMWFKALNFVYLSATRPFSSNNLNPVVSYLNAQLQKESIIKDNRGKSGVYL